MKMAIDSPKNDFAEKHRWLTYADEPDTVYDGSKIMDGSVTTDKLADYAVTTDKIDDESITTVKLDDEVITTPKLADGAVTLAKLDDGAVTTSKLADGAVTGAKIADGTVTDTNLATEVLSGIKASFDVKYPMPTIDGGSKYQCKISDNAYSIQSACAADGKLYLFFANSSNNLKMITIDTADGTSAETNLSINGHANTATITGNETILLSSNGSTDIYEISTSGSLLNTYTAPVADCCVVYDVENDRYIGTSRTNNKFYYFDSSMNLDATEDFNWSFINGSSGPVAMQNCAFDSGIFYASFRPNSVYAVNVQTMQFVNMFRIAFSPTSEFEGVVFIDNKLYSLQHGYTERVTSVNPIFAGNYMPYNGYNGELTFVNESYIDSLCNTITMYVDYDAASSICYGTQAYPFKSLSQAFERSYSYKDIVILLKGNPSNAVSLTIGNASIAINAWDNSNKPTIPGLVVAGNGSLSLSYLIVSVDSGNAIEFKDKSNINAHIANCEISSTSGTGIAVNWGNNVEIRDTTTISALTAISSVNACVSVSPSSITSGIVNNSRNSYIGNKQEILHNNATNDFTTKIPITAFRLVVGLIKTKVQTYNFYIPYTGVVDSNKLYAFGARYASVVGDAVTATVEGNLSDNGTTFSRTGGTTDAVIYTMFGIL
jgi:VCBS repeat-containing protein